MTTSRPCKLQKELEAIFVGDAVPEKFGTHPVDCSSCREVYDRLAMASRAVEAKELSSFEIDFAERAIFEALEEEASPSLSPGRDRQHPQHLVKASNLRYMRYAAAAVVAIAGSATLYLATVDFTGPSPSTPDEFQARSAVTAAPPSLPRPTLELFCAERPGGDDVAFGSTLDAPFGALSCPIDAELKLAYTNPDPRLTHAAFFGVDRTGQLYWYGPSPADGAPMTITTTSALEPIGESIRLVVNHGEGLIRVHGVFSSQPIDYKAISALVEAIPAHQRFEATTLDAFLNSFSGLSRATSRTFEIRGGTP